MSHEKHYELVEGDLLEASEKYIVHQTNCVTNHAAGIARAIFDRFPWSDVYSGDYRDRRPGSIIIRGNGDDERFVIALFGQFNGGGMRRNDGIDDEIRRHGMWISGLNSILEIEDLESVAFPWKIGCGIAGGDWEGWYEPSLNEFAEKARSKGVITRIYRLPS